MSLHLCRGCRDAATSLPRGILSGKMTERGSGISDQASAAPPAPPAPPTQSDPAKNNPEPDVGDPKAVIDEVLLIEEVKKFPILYVHAYDDYMEKMAKIKNWNKVCQALFKDWRDYSPQKKRVTIKKVQNTWQKQKDTFFKTYNGVHKRSTAKKTTKNMNSLMFLVPPTDASNVDEEACASNTNPDAPQIHIANVMPMMEMIQPELEIPVQSEIEIATQTEPEIPQVHIPDNPPMPSTSEQGYAMAYEFVRAHEINYKPTVFIPLPQQRTNPNMHFARMILPLLNRLTPVALYHVWPEILNIIKKYELTKHTVQTIEQRVIHEAQRNVELSSVPTAEGPPKEIVQEEETDVQDNPIYPSSYGRPTNSEGEIMYPETDHEDLDEG